MTLLHHRLKLSVLTLAILAPGAAQDVNPRQFLPSCPTPQVNPNLGWRVGDLHAHTKESYDGTNTASEMIQRYKNLGFDFGAISEHSDQMLAFLDVCFPWTWERVYGEQVALAASLNQTMLIGLEKTTAEYYRNSDGTIDTKGGHAGAGGNHTLCFAGHRFWIPAGTTVDAAMRTTRDEGGFPGIAHPYGGTYLDERNMDEVGDENWGLRAESYPYILNAMGRLGSGTPTAFGVEVINDTWSTGNYGTDATSFSAWVNHVLLKGGRGVPLGNTDAHSTGAITGNTRTAVLATGSGLPQVLDGLKAGHTFASYGPLGVGLWIRPAGTQEPWIPMGSVVSTPFNRNWEFYVSTNSAAHLTELKLRLYYADLELPESQRAEVDLLGGNGNPATGAQGAQTLTFPTLRTPHNGYVRAELRGKIGAAEQVAFTAPVWFDVDDRIPAKPVNLRIQKTAANEAQLSWDLGDEGVAPDYVNIYRAENASNPVPTCGDATAPGWTRVEYCVPGTTRSMKVFIPYETDPTAFTVNAYKGTVAVYRASCYATPVVQAPTKVHNAQSFSAHWSGGNAIRCQWYYPTPVTGLQLQYQAVYPNGTKGPLTNAPTVNAPTRETVLSGLDGTAHHFDLFYRTQLTVPGQSTLYSDWNQQMGYLAWSAPQELTQVGPAFINRVDLTWKEMYIYTGAFDLERSEDGIQPYQWVKTVPPCSTGLGIYTVTATDTTCAPGQRYHYRVKRQDALRLPSPVATATTALPAPVGVTAVRTATVNQVDLSWTQPATEIPANNFRIYRRAKINGVWQPEEFVKSVLGTGATGYSTTVPALGGGLTPQVWKVYAEAWVSGPILTSAAGQSAPISPNWIVVGGF